MLMACQTNSSMSSVLYTHRTFASSHCADEKTEAPKGEMTFSKPYGQVFWFQTRIPGFNYVLLSREGNWDEWFNSMGIKERNGVFRRAHEGHARVDRAASSPDSRVALGEHGRPELRAGKSPGSTTEWQGPVVVK